MLDARARFQRLDGKRQASLNRARDCSALTIPALLPPLGHSDNNPLPTPYQSLGARGVNNLASKLLIAVFPPGQSSFRMQIDASVRQQFGVEKTTEAEARLADIEQRATAKIEGSSIRPLMYEVLANLVTTGNVLFNKARDGARMYRLDQYVVSRAPNGEPIECVVKESVAPASLSDETAIACEVDKSKNETPVDVYTLIEWKGGKVIERQEINGKLVPGSVGVRPKKKSRWMPLRWRAVPGQDYGRGHVEEYLGDLRSLEGLCQSIVQFAAAASKILFGVRPGAITSIDDIFKTESGGAFTGLKDDIFVLQLEKSQDFQVAKAVVDELAQRLSQVFLLRAGTVRDAERVTAEEIRALAQELEDALGGTYTVIADEFQLPFVRLVLSEMQQAGELPALPEGVVEPVIVTGFAALGRNHAVNRLRSWLADLAAVSPETLQVIKKDVIARRLGIGWGVENLDELIKSPDEQAAEMQQSLMGQVTDKATAPIAGALAKVAAQ